MKKDPSDSSMSLVAFFAMTFDFLFYLSDTDEQLGESQFQILVQTNCLYIEYRWVNPRQNDKSRARSCRRFYSNLDIVLRKSIKSYVPSPRFVALSVFELLSLKNRFFSFWINQNWTTLLFRVTISPSKVNTNFLYMKM